MTKVVNEIITQSSPLELAYSGVSLVGRVGQNSDKVIYNLVPRLVHLGDCWLADVSYSD